MSNKCNKCESVRLASVSGKVSDCFWCTDLQSDKDYEGYVPDDLGIGGGDYIQFTYCLDCGQIRGDFPQDGASIAGIDGVQWTVKYILLVGDDDKEYTATIPGDEDDFDEEAFDDYVSAQHPGIVLNGNWNNVEITYSEQA